MGSEICECCGGADMLDDPSLVQGGEDLSGDPRPSQLRDLVAQLVDGNNARAAEVALLKGKTLRFGLTFKITWTIRSQWRSDTHFGNQTQNAVCHGGNRAVDMAAQAEADAILAEGRGLDRLHERVRNSPEQVFREADGEIDLRLGRSHAYCYECPNRFCRGGRVTCFTCNGNGGAWVSVTRYDSSNRPYSVSEWRTCGDCGGAGDHRCNTCGGHGCLTYRAEVDSFAKPSVTFGFDGGANHAAMRSFIKDTPMQRLGADYLETPLRDFRKLSSSVAELQYGVTAMKPEDAAPMEKALAAAMVQPGTPASWSSADGRRQGRILVTSLDQAEKCATLSQEIVLNGHSDMTERQTACAAKQQPGGWVLR